jgi:uroporphyrinogen III methyltransferase / synthase
MEKNAEKTNREEEDKPSGEASPVPLLYGKAILLTRPRQQSEEMTTMLEALGAKVIHAPTIELREPDSWDAIDESIHQLDLYDWLIFTSVNGVKFFFQRLAQKSTKPLAQLSKASVCAIGLATAKAVESAGAKVDLVATDSHAEGVLQALLFYTGSLQALRNLRFLLPRAKLAREVLPTELRKLGAQVNVVEAYQNIMPEMGSDSILALFRDTDIDVITFTSSSTVHNFVAMVGKENLPELLRNSRIACIGPVTGATAEEYDLQNIIQPDSYTAAALVEAIVQAIGKK